MMCMLFIHHIGFIDKTRGKANARLEDWRMTLEGKGEPQVTCCKLVIVKLNIYIAILVGENK